MARIETPDLLPFASRSEINDLISQLDEIVVKISMIRGHRATSLARTKVEEAKFWLQERLDLACERD